MVTGTYPAGLTKYKDTSSGLWGNRIQMLILEHIVFLGIVHGSIIMHIFRECCEDPLYFKLMSA